MEENNRTIFDYLDPSSNDKLSDMRGMDLLDLIVLLNGYYIPLRSTLGFSSDITFGLELEIENTDINEIAIMIDESFGEKWDTTGDSTLYDGAEIISPILKDSIQTWQDLDEVCDIVRPLASIDNHSGGHIHIGTQLLGGKKQGWLNFIKLWSVYENIIFRFTYGNFLNARKTVNEYARAIAMKFWDVYQKSVSSEVDLPLMIASLSRKRYQAVNFCNINRDSVGSFKQDNTIEFRCPNGSLDPVIWQNNVNLFVKLLKYARSSNFDDDLIEKRHRIFDNRYVEFVWYNEIFLEQALELCDMIFDNNLDKVYFLKQYLKEYRVCQTNSELKRAPQLTKTLIKR